MRYIDRHGSTITRDQWLTLYRSPAAVVERTEALGLTIETTWVGMAFDSEAEPKLFLVEAYRVSGTGTDERRRQQLASDWYATERRALVRHRELERQYLPVKGGAA